MYNLHTLYISLVIIILSQNVGQYFSYVNAKELLNCMTLNITEYARIYFVVFLVVVHCLHMDKGKATLIVQNVKFDK